MIFLCLILYVVICYVFLIINSGLRLLNRKLKKETEVWTFKDAVRSWGYDDEDVVVMPDTRRMFSFELFDWPWFSFMFFVSPFIFFYFVFMIFLKLITLPILHFIGENY